MWRWLSWTSAILACGGSSGSAPGDAARGDAVDAAIHDSLQDAPQGPSELIVNDGTGTISAWVADDAGVGGLSTSTLFILNQGTGATSALTTAVSGPDANDFLITDTGSHCTGNSLAAGDLCEIKLAFMPSAAGSRTASLEVHGATTPLVLPLGGTASMAPAPGLVSAVTVDFGIVGPTQSATAQVLLSNTSSAPIALGTRTTAPPFFIRTIAALPPSRRARHARCRWGSRPRSSGSPRAR